MKQQQQRNDSSARSKVGVVIGSGGLKTLGAVALFDLLDEANIEPDLLVGCSGGGLMCALRAAGFRTAHIKELMSQLSQRNPFTQLDYRALLNLAWPRLFPSDRPRGLLKPERLQKLYDSCFGDLRLEDLPTKTLLQTTDINTGNGVVLSRGRLADAVYASTAIPSLFPPLRMGEQYLADGVHSAPLPVLEAVKRGMDVIIALDFQANVRRAPRSLVDYLHSGVDTFCQSLTYSQLFTSMNLHHHAIIPIRVQFDRHISLLDLPEIPTILAESQRVIAGYKEEILHAIKVTRQPLSRSVQARAAFA
ncbi:MAG: patatin-like phospholipase family protein [Blastocatellia bacterium]